jgi:hypothetical protein
MSFFDDFRRERARLTGEESIATLDYMEDFLNGGEGWAKGVYTSTNGTRCLVAAADYARSSKIDDAKYWLRQAIAERAPQMRTIEEFNDSRQSFAEIEAVIRRARDLARQAQLPAVRPVAAVPVPVTGEILPPATPAPVMRSPAPVVRDVTPRPPRRRSVVASILADFFSD